MKTNILKVSIALIFLVCFNALFFILGGTEQSKVNWISYGFIHVAYLLIWVTPFIASKSKGLTVLRGSLYLHAVIYFFVELGAGLAFISIQPENVLLTFAIQCVGLAVFLVLQIVGVIANDATETSLQKQVTESAYIKTMAMQVKSAMRNIEDQKVRNSVIRCYESLNNSSVESFPELKDAELALSNSVEALCIAIAGGDNTQIEEKASSVLTAIQARNEAVKSCRMNNQKPNNVIKKCLQFLLLVSFLSIPVWNVGKAEPVNSPLVRTYTVNGVSFHMVEVTGGTFMMGATSEQVADANDDETPVHSVTLDSYFIGKTEVTQALWRAVMGSNPSQFSGDNHPVENVSWNDCQQFIIRLNTLTGKQFRLPTEAEWEFAARGGNESKGNRYCGSNALDDVAWNVGNSDETTHDVATRRANELGLYDMSGNVFEWCSDRYGDYSSSSQVNPTGPDGGENRIFRGGCWFFGDIDCRLSSRGCEDPNDGGHGLGLRITLSE